MVLLGHGTKFKTGLIDPLGQWTYKNKVMYDCVLVDIFK